MWTHFWHLVFRSLLYAPSIISQNWVSIFIPVAIFLVREGARIKKEGWHTVNWKSVRTDSAYMIGAYALLLGCAVVHIVYVDHEDLVGSNSRLRAEIAQYKDNSSPKLGGWINVTNLRRKPSRIDQLLLVDGIITNQGAPTAITDMSLKIRFGDGHTITGEISPAPLDPVQLSSRTDAHGPLFLEPQDYWTQVEKNNLIPTGGDRRGWLYAAFTDVTTKTLEDSHATVVFTVTDITGRAWSLEQSISEDSKMKKGKFGPVPQ
jgi:hypothetical protein